MRPCEPSETELRVYQQTIEEINRQSEACFPEMNTFMKHKTHIDSIIDKLIAENCPGDIIPDQPLYSPGHGDVQLFRTFSENVSEAADQMKSSSSLQAPALAPETVNNLWHNWMKISEFLFIQLTRFAKLLPGFGDLDIDDRIILLKAARIEVSTVMA